jgi:hypothetical protein
LSISWQLSVPPPALFVPPPAAASLDEAHYAIAFWEYYSKKQLDSAQKLAVELMMAETSDGRWAAKTTGRAVSRQNGKGDELEVVEAYCLVRRKEWILHSAHELPTARAAHRRLVDFFDSHRDLRKLVRKRLYGNADRSIEMTNGAIIVYRTRTVGGGRGLDDISRLVIDEAQLVQEEHLAAAMPILAVNPNSQANFTGSAGIAERSDWWWSLRIRALRAGADLGDFAYLEHSAEKVELNRDGRVLSTAPKPEDRAAWQIANPAYGTRITEWFLAEAYENLGPDLFAREHLCVWDPYTGGEGGFLPFDVWEGLKIPEPDTMRSVCFGLSSNGETAALASAGRLPSGDLYVDTVEEKFESGLLPHLIDLYRRKKVPIRVNPTAPEGALVRPLTEAGVEVIEVAARDYQQACGEILDSIKNGVIRHLGQASLNRAVRSVQRRDVGKEGGWVWAEPSSGVDLSTLKAATLALTGVTAKRGPRIHVYKPREEEPSGLLV